MAAQGHCVRMTSDVEVCMMQRGGIEFLHAEKMAPTDTYQCLLNICGGETVDVNTAVRGAFQQWQQC